MVTINPAWVIGPLIQPTLNLSAEVVLNLINGTLQQLMKMCFMLCFLFLYLNISTCLVVNIGSTPSESPQNLNMKF